MRKPRHGLQLGLILPDVLGLLLEYAADLPKPVTAQRHITQGLHLLHGATDAT